MTSHTTFHDNFHQKLCVMSSPIFTIIFPIICTYEGAVKNLHNFWQKFVMRSRTNYSEIYGDKFVVKVPQTFEQIILEKLEDAYVGGFVTNDSGIREEYSTGMQRDTERGKPRFTLLFPKLLPYSQNLIVRFAALMGRGAEKYKTRNWESAATAEELERYLSSAFRHFVQWQEALTGPCDCYIDEFGDRDDTCDLHSEDHAAAVLFNIMGAEYVNWRLKQ